MRQFCFQFSGEGIIKLMSIETDRVTDPEPQPDDRIDQALRPTRLVELIGQDQVNDSGIRLVRDPIRALKLNEMLCNSKMISGPLDPCSPLG